MIEKNFLSSCLMNPSSKDVEANAIYDEASSFFDELMNNWDFSEFQFEYDNKEGIWKVYGYSYENEGKICTYYRQHSKIEKSINKFQTEFNENSVISGTNNIFGMALKKFETIYNEEKSLIYVEDFIKRGQLLVNYAQTIINYCLNNPIDWPSWRDTYYNLYEEFFGIVGAVCEDLDGNFPDLDIRILSYFFQD